MQATLTELRRDTAKVVKALHGGQNVILTQHGEPCAEIVPARKFDRKRALRDLMAVGPVAFRPRK